MASVSTLKKIAKISKYTGFTSLCYFMNRNRKRTIAYHNIIPDKYWDNSIHLSHSMKESSFKKQIEVIEKRFNIDLDIDNYRTVTLTFDDGYLNQCLVASKILNEKNLNAYFFCVSDLINKQHPLDMDMLQYWISYVPFGNYKISEANLELNVENEGSRKSEWQKISDKLDEGIKLENMTKYLDKYYSFNEIRKLQNQDDMYKIRFNPIDYENIKRMKKKGHKIGAHTAKHLRLSQLSKDEIIEDIRICKNNIGNLYNTKVFCYPYGSENDISQEVIKELKRNNFTKAFAYSNGPLKNIEYNDHFIPRIFMSDTDDVDLINFILSGAKHFISFRKLLPRIRSENYDTKG